MRESSVRVFLGIFFTFSVARSQLPTALPCSIRGVALVGGDLADSDGGGGFAAEDAAECQYECDRRANCNFWSHVDEWKINCYIKEEAGEERKLDGATTGWKGEGCESPKRKENPEETGLLDNEGCKIDDMAFLGADLTRDRNGDGVTVRSFVECRTACRHQPGCAAFTFVKDWELNCFLKSERGEESEFVGAISGTLTQCTDQDRERPRQSLTGQSSWSRILESVCSYSCQGAAEGIIEGFFVCGFCIIIGMFSH